MSTYFSVTTITSAHRISDRTPSTAWGLMTPSDPLAATVFTTNFPYSRFARAHVEEYFDGSLGASPTLLETAVREWVGKVDVLIGGPPCQAFSVFGNRAGIEDARGQLVFEFVRLVNELRPHTFVMENVAQPVHGDRLQQLGK